MYNIGEIPISETRYLSGVYKEESQKVAGSASVLFIIFVKI